MKTYTVMFANGKGVEYKCDKYVLLPNNKSPELAEFRVVNKEKHTYRAIGHVRWCEVLSLADSEHGEMFTRS